jgi:UDP-2-acetamido-3-amino-2,3-dideoxy-glucuronate N-acetyltransferase
MTARVHPTALIEAGVELGDGTSVWDNVHIRGPARIGDQCIIGEKTYIAYGVTIGHRVKINAMVYICTEVTIEDGVMLSAGATFTNDRYPRATTPDLQELRSSDPDEDTLATIVRAGATIGARAVIGPGLEIGSFSMVGMGAVVTRTVPDFHLVVGQPARSIGVVCRCGPPLDISSTWQSGSESVACARCGRRYEIAAGIVTEVETGAVSTEAGGA